MDFQSSSVPHVIFSSIPFSYPFFPSCVPCLTSLPCLPSYVPCLTSLFLIVSRPLSPVSRLCSLSPVLCTQSHLICPLAPILLSLSPNPYQLSQWPLFCGSILLFLSFVPLFPIFCSSVSFPLSIVFHTCENASFSKQDTTHAYIYSLAIYSRYG